MEFFVVVYDFLKVKIGKRSIPNLFFSFLMMYVLSQYYENITELRFKGILGNMINVLGILLGFTASIFAVIFTSKNKKLDEIKNTVIYKKVTLYDSLMLGYAFLIFLFGLELVIAFFLLIMLDKDTTYFEVIFYINSFLFVFSIFQLLGSFLELYFVITKQND